MKFPAVHYAPFISHPVSSFFFLAAALGLSQLVSSAAAPNAAGTGDAPATNASATTPAAGSAQKTLDIGPCRLLLPKVVYAAPGQEANLYFDNIVLAPRGRSYLFDVTCAKGMQQEERWTWTPTEQDSGDYPLAVEVRDLDDRVVATGSTTVRVPKADAGKGRAIAQLAIGDSLTHASVYTDELLKLFAKPANPQFKLVGTHHPEGTVEGNVHEGYGGWAFATFVDRYIADNPTPEKRGTGSSPFVFLENDKPTLDFPRYVREKLGGTPPDVITIFLGCNDNFHATDATIEGSIDTMMAAADTLLASIRAGAPQAKIGIVTTVPPSASQDAFGENYKVGQTRWQYQKNQHRVVDRMMQKFDGREAENIFIVPAYVNLDCEHNFPTREAPANARTERKIVRAINGVHPAPEGYRQIADSIYSWMKSILQ